MKISVNVEEDGINVLALDMGKTALEVDGIEMDELIDAINSNGYMLRIASTPGEIIVEEPLSGCTSLFQFRHQQNESTL